VSYDVGRFVVVQHCRIETGGTYSEERHFASLEACNVEEGAAGDAQLAADRRGPASVGGVSEALTRP